MFQVKKAKRQRRPLKISLEGLSGSGKTYTALRLAFALRRAGIGKKIVVADSENESAGIYTGIVTDGEKWDYDVCDIPPASQNPQGYTMVYEYLVKEGYDIVIIDSMSHAWHGAMEQVDAHAQRNKGDKFGGWAKVTPDQRRMLSTLTDTRAHLIATMRVKGEYERVEGSNGKERIKKVGMKVDQREGSEYEFDCVVRLDPENHRAQVEKIRGCTAMDGIVGDNPGPEFWKPLIDWWLTGDDLEQTADKFIEDDLTALVKECTNQGELDGVLPKLTEARRAGKLSPDATDRLARLVKSQREKLPIAREPGDEEPDGSLPGMEQKSEMAPAH